MNGESTPAEPDKRGATEVVLPLGSIVAEVSVLGGVCRGGPMTPAGWMIVGRAGRPGGASPGGLRLAVFQEREAGAQVGGELLGGGVTIGGLLGQHLFEDEIESFGHIGTNSAQGRNGHVAMGHDLLDGRFAGIGGSSGEHGVEGAAEGRRYRARRSTVPLSRACSGAMKS